MANKASKIISLFLCLIMALSAPFSACASTVTGSILTSNQYTHSSEFDGCEMYQGIDVSYAQGNIDWAKVKKAGVKFAIIRAGYRGYGGSGTLVKDNTFDENIKGAYAQGLDIGVYFYSQALNTSEAKAEAKFILNIIKSYKSYITLPVAFDYEFADVYYGRLNSAWRNGTVNKSIMTDNALAFCKDIEAAGFGAMVYANKSFLTNNLDHERLEQFYPVWIAHYTTNTDYRGNYNFWQYTSSGKVNGINAYVDGDFMYNSLNASNVGRQIETGKQIKPRVTVTSKSGEKLTEGKDYTIEYKNNINVGTAQIVISGIGSYSYYPKLYKTFEIVPAPLTNLKADEIGMDYISVSWDKYSGASGYELSIKTEKGWEYPGTTADNYYTFKSLKSGYEYEISIRAYKTVNGYKYGGHWGKEYLKVKTSELPPETVSPSITGWKKVNGKWYYYLKGVLRKNWQKINDKWYFFDENGTMYTGWLDWKGRRYYLTANGDMAIYWLEIDGKWYYFNGNGVMQTGWHPSGSKMLYLTADGSMAVYLYDIDGSRYYFDANGYMQKGWIDYSGKRYFANEKGVIQKLSQTIDGNRYYFGDDGSMRTGWVKELDEWYYYSQNGAAVRGWLKINNKWYYFYENYTMLTGWLDENERRYYLGESGVMLTGWKEIDGKWYFFNNGGSMRTGWLKYNNKWYYLMQSGEMNKFWLSVDGKWYYFKSNGEMKTGWHNSSGGKWYYLSSSGAMVTGTQRINGKLYTFSSSGVLQ